MGNILVNGSPSVMAGLAIHLEFPKLSLPRQPVTNIALFIDAVLRTDLLTSLDPTGDPPGSYTWRTGIHVMGAAPFGFGDRIIKFQGKDPGENLGVIEKTISVVPVPADAVVFNFGDRTINGPGPWSISLNPPGAYTVEVVDVPPSGQPAWGFNPVSETLWTSLNNVSFKPTHPMDGSADGDFILRMRFRAKAASPHVVTVDTIVTLDTIAPRFDIIAIGE